ncbi:MAG: XRE family transcriptional regulator [Hymenobacter sp.]|nr:MAG: XRE family transcriptional regulator [Hymenobacter sp.]
MFTRRSILSRPTYWLTENRMDFMRAVEEYMEANNMNRKQLAEHLKCSRSYVSQILNGDTNLSIEKLYDIALAIGKVPTVKYEDLEAVLQRDAIQCEVSHEGVINVISGYIPMYLPEEETEFNIITQY